MLADEAVRKLIFVLFEENYQVYGRRKIRKALVHEHGLIVDKDCVSRLMADVGIRGVHRGKQPWTTKAETLDPRAPDLVHRRFVADRPNQLWVSDFTYVFTWSGFAYVAFTVDVYSRLVVGWRATTSMFSLAVNIGATPRTDDRI